MKNPYKLLVDRISEKGYSLGTWITINSPEVAEIASYIGLDWVVIDMEHAPLDFYDAEMLLMGLANDAIVGIVRIPLNDPVYVKRALDIGSDGLLAPLISSEKDARDLVRYASYPPKGIRGVGPRRASRYGLIPLREYVEHSRSILLLVQIETREALMNLDSILEVEEIHGVFVGPNDLAMNMGAERDFTNPYMQKMLSEIAGRAVERKRIIGIMTYTPEEARKAIELGYNFIALGSDTSALIRGLKTFKESLENR